MNTLRILVSPLAALALAAPAAPAIAAPVGTAFTYQGQLNKSGVPLQGNCNFQFKLWDDAGAGSQVGTTQTVNNVAVAGGLFTVTLDFGGGMFAGAARWLEIAVQGPGDPGFTPLSPRQPLTPAPYALYALASPGGGGGLTLPFAGSTNSPTQTAFEADNIATTGLYHGVLGVTYSTTQNAAGVQGEGRATSGYTSGVQGWAVNSPLGTGVVGHGQARGGWFQSLGAGSFGVEGVGILRGVSGSASAGDGVYGTGTNAGLYGDGTAYGVVGNSHDGFGVYGTYGAGLFPAAGNNAGVYGSSVSTGTGSAGVRGVADVGTGVEGISTSGHGVTGTTSVASHSGVFGVSSAGDGVFGVSNASYKSGVVGISNTTLGWGGYFRNTAGGTALSVDGMAVTKTLQILGGSDLAEPFDVTTADGSPRVEPGMVVAIDPDRPGDLRLADRAYDAAVAGVISGANRLAPGMVMKSEGDAYADGAHPVALTGRVWCRADAGFGAIRPGDLLTTSPTPGHAMKATDRERAGGAILGKAMTALADGRGLVLVLVSLQ
jgi:hypothetical protein